MAEAIGSAILGSLGLSAFGQIGFLGTSVNAVVGTVVISATNLAVNSAVQRHMEAQAKRKMLEATKGYLLNTIEPTSNQQFVYGKIRKGGAITFQESTGVENKFLHMIICLAGHEVNAIKKLSINNIEIESRQSRHYPLGQQISPLIGFYGRDGALEGLSLIHI